MGNNNNHFNKYPHGNEEVNELSMMEGLVYVSLYFFHRGSSDMYPSLQRIAETANLSIKTVDKSVKGLIDKKYITRNRKGKKYYYTLLEKDKQFETFSDAFLLNPILSAREKAYIIAITRFMFKNITDGTGDISFTNKEMARRINVSERVVIELNKALMDKHILQDSKAATKKFNLRLIDQMIILELANQKEDIEDLKVKYAEVKQEVLELRKALAVKTNKENQNNKVTGIILT